MCSYIAKKGSVEEVANRKKSPARGRKSVKTPTKSPARGRKSVESTEIDDQNVDSENIENNAVLTPLRR